MPSRLSPKTRLKIQKNNQQYLNQVVENISIKPQEGKQELFYNSDVDVVFYGGAAGGGKSFLLLLDAARPEYLKNPLYNAVVFRRTTPEFTMPGGLVDESKKIYNLFNGSLTERPNIDWKFPNGVRIAFRHLQHEKNVTQYQGSQINKLSFDELSHFSEESFFYLLSRNRSVSGIKPKVRATMNPDADSWIANFIKWYWNPSTGYPIEERAGIIRYFIRVNNVVHWADTAEELIEKFDLKEKIQELIPEDVKERLRRRKNKDDKKELIAEDIFTPKSFTFIPANVFDNLELIEKNPSYIIDLYNQHPVNRERLLKGNWLIKFEAGTVFDRNWFKIVDSLPEAPTKTVRFWDMAATAKEINPDACYSAGLKMCQIDNDFYILDLAIAQVKAGDTENMIKNFATLDGKNVTTAWELEGGSAGKIVESSLKREILKQNPSNNVEAVKPQGDKLTRALPVAQAASQGKIYLLRDTWNNQLLNSCQSFDGTKKDPPINDIIDSLSGAYNYLINKKTFSKGSTVALVRKGDIRFNPNRHRR